VNAPSLSTVLSIGVLGFMAVRLVDGVRASRRSGGRSLVAAVLARMGRRHVWPVLPLLTVIVVVASLLSLVPGLSWGWWSAIGGEGNPAFGSSDATAGTFWEWLIPLVFVALLLPALPLFAFAEERIFRRGTETWSTPRRLWKALQFGLVHALIGIPIAAALALSIGGWWFQRVYLGEYRRTGSVDAALLESTTAHTVYNGAIICLVAVAFVALAFGAPI
jgi:hypothetical protein